MANRLTTAPFRLHARTDLDALARRYAERGRVHVASLLDMADAERLAAHLHARSDWCLMLNHGERLYELDPATQREVGAAQLAELTRAARRSGHDRFQYLYENVRVPDEAAAWAARDDLLARFAEFLTSPEMLALVRRLTGRDDIAFADGRATRYREGHFLTTHDDDVSVKHRVAACVVGLTHAWRAEWGGQLQFLDGEGHVAEGFVPRSYALNLLAVPQPHLVSPVTALAGPLAARFSVTGWFRSAGPP